MAAVAVFCAVAPAYAADPGTMVLAQASQGNASPAEAMLLQATEARRAKDFEQARDVLAGLERQVGQGHPLYQRVRDERYFHLPLAVAQQAINEGEAGLAESKIDEAERYLSGHPRRGELSRIVERHRRALWMIK
jgi:hypothetical protein